jgi:transmembrane sensor
MTSPGMNWERIGRYLAGEASREEAAEVRRWLDDHRADADVVAAVERLTTAIRNTRSLDVEGALKRVKARHTPARAPVAIAKPGRLRRWMTQTEVLAAAAAIILVAGTFLFDDVRDLVRGGAPSTYTTPVGQRDSVRMEDGSLILLGPASRVAIRGREVDLTGEAFFRVVHDDARPFIVRAGESVIRDIGTEFAVHTNDATAASRVVVQEGSVALRRGADSVMLHEGDVGHVAEGRVESLPGSATADDFAWMRGELVFRDTPISTVIADLRRWYGVEVRVADTALLQRRFTGTFTTEPRERVLDVIAMTLPARVERRGDTAYFRSATSSK